MIDVLSVKALVSHQLAIIENPERREALLRLLTEPVLEHRAWQYGPVPQRFPCWVVGRAPAEGLAFVYCEHGFGPAFPWGCVEDDSGGLGMDAQWNWYLEEAFVQSGLWPGPVLASEPYHSPPEKRFPRP